MLLCYQVIEREILHSLVTVGISSRASSRDFSSDSVVYHQSDLGKLFHLSNTSIFSSVKWA